MVQDAGGVELADGRRMRRGVLFRVSGALLDDAALYVLVQAGVRRAIDFRIDNEDRSLLVDWTSGAAVEYHHLPIRVGAQLHDPDAYGLLRNAYAKLAVDYGDVYVAALDLLASGLPAAFGCAAGKDRTGVFAAYLHVLLGAAENTAVRTHVACAPPADVLRTQIEADERYLVTQPWMMRHAFDTVRERGGVEAFLREHGLSDATLDQLRAELVEA